MSNRDCDAPPELLEQIHAVMAEAWQSPGGMIVDAHPCSTCPNHWHIMVCPAVRELMGGPQDGEMQYARFVLNVNKVMRAFDKRPRTFFDTAQGQSVPHVMFVGKIKGYKCDLSVMCCPPINMDPSERVWTEGPKAGEVEVVQPDEESNGQ